MCVEIVLFLVTWVCYNFMAAEILPKQRREMIVLGYGNYRVIALWRVKPVIVNTGKSPLARATRMLTQDNCLIVLWRNQNTGGKY